MARRPRLTSAQRRQINDLLEPYSTQFREAFLRAIQDLRDRADYGRLLKAIQDGNIQEAVAALHIDAAAFEELRRVTAASYAAGGSAALAALPPIYDSIGNEVVVRFDTGNPAAQGYIEQYAGDMIRSITDDQLAASRLMLSSGIQEGMNPRDIARELVGTIDRATGRRSGGILGLTEIQTQYVTNARNELMSSSPADLKHYLTRMARDKRFDRSVLKSIQTGEPLSVELINKMVASYENRLLSVRAEAIARTEMLKSLHVAQHQSYRQLVAQGLVRPEQVRRVWRTARDRSVRDSHVAMEGQSVGLEEAFVSGNGNRLMFPGDPNAPAEDIINCRCDLEARIDFLSNIGPDD